MTDIVERLAEASATKQYASLEFGCVACGVDANLLAEAADEIERLRAENERLRAALKTIARREAPGSENYDWAEVDYARDVLATANKPANTADAKTDKTYATR